MTGRTFFLRQTTPNSAAHLHSQSRSLEAEMANTAAGLTVADRERATAMMTSARHSLLFGSEQRAVVHGPIGLMPA